MLTYGGVYHSGPTRQNSRVALLYKTSVLVNYLQHEAEELQSVSMSLQVLSHIEVQHTQWLSLHMRPPLVLKVNAAFDGKMYALHCQQKSTRYKLQTEKESTYKQKQLLVSNLQVSHCNSPTTAKDRGTKGR